MADIRRSFEYGLRLWPFAMSLAVGIFLTVLGGGVLIGFVQGNAAQPPFFLVVGEFLIGSVLIIAGFFGALHYMWHSKGR